MSKAVSLRSLYCQARNLHPSETVFLPEGDVPLHYDNCPVAFLLPMSHQPAPLPWLPSLLPPAPDTPAIAATIEGARSTGADRPACVQPIGACRHAHNPRHIQRQAADIRWCCPTSSGCRRRSGALSAVAGDLSGLPVSSKGALHCQRKRTEVQEPGDGSAACVYVDRGWRIFSGTIQLVLG